MKVDSLCDRFLQWALSRKKPKTYKEYARYVNQHIIPRFGKMHVSDVSAMDVESYISQLRATPILANRLISTLSKLFNMAEKWGFRPQGSNPTRHAERYREKARKRYLSKEEATKIMDRLTFYEKQRPQAVAFLWLLLYTGARPAEIAQARPEQLKGNRFELEDHKTDRTGRDRIIYLPPQAVAVISSLPRYQGGTITGIKSPTRLWRTILEETGITGLRMYDLRHNFASVALASGSTLGEIGELLGHSCPTSTKRYAHLIEDVAVARATKIAAYIDNMGR